LTTPAQATAPLRIRVFISFVTEDKPVAQAVQGLLAKQLDLPGQVFLSTDLVAGQQWLDEIRAAIESAELLIAMLSARALKRPWINFESGAAWILKKPLIPVCYGMQRKSALPHPYSNFQAIDLPGGENDLLTGVHKHLGLPGAPKIERGIDRIGKLMAEQSPQTKLTSLLSDPFEWLKFHLDTFKDEP
jgi:hypothetical protein